VELAGAKIPQNVQIDGHSIAELISGKTKDSQRQWILGMGYGPARLTQNGVEPVHQYADRVVRDKQYKLWIGTDRNSSKLFDLKIDPGEKMNLINSNAPEIVAAREKLEAIAKSFPQTDARPIYAPTPAQPWDMTPEKMDKFLQNYKH